jgi:hypothetical protein
MGRVSGEWIYTDERGLPLLRKVRREGDPKNKFRMQAARYAPPRGLYWKGERGCVERWQSEFGERALYNLPIIKDALIAGATVYLCEGERDADTWTALFKKAATTGWQGASDFTYEQARWFMLGKGTSKIRILMDNDDAGIAGAWLRRRRLKAVGVDPKRIRLLRPSDPAHSDATDVALAGLGRCGWDRVRPSEARLLARAYEADRASRRGSSDWMDR